MYIIFLGAPGAGKGTQASKVAETLKLVHVATGDLFRQAQEGESELGRQAKVYMENGQLVPDEITIRMVLERISAPDCQSGVIFDGFPRNLKQAEALDAALLEQGKAVGKVVYIKVSEKELLERLSGRRVCRQCQATFHILNAPPKGGCSMYYGSRGVRCDQCGGELYQRPDDAAPVVKKRLEVYFAETAPLIDYYTRAGKLVEVNGEGGLAVVKKRIVKAISGEVVSSGRR